MYIIHIISLYKSFSSLFDKILRKNIKKKRRDGEAGKHKLREMGALNRKWKK